MTTAQMELPRGAQLVRYLHQNEPPWAGQIPTAGGQTTILHGDPGSGIEQAAAWIAEAEISTVGPVVTCDVGLIGDYTSLVHELAAQIVAGVFGDEAASALSALRRGESRDLLGSEFATDDFLGFAATLNRPELSYLPGELATVLRNTPRSLLLITNAHLLTARWSRDALWEIRGVVQDEGRHGLLLTCPTEARDALAGEAAPFFGAGAIAAVGADRDDRFWIRVARTHGLDIGAGNLEFILANTWGLAVPTLAVLIDAQQTGVSGALDGHVRNAHDRVPLALGMARVINRYGPELLLRLSRGLAPYAIPSATARDISRALRQLGFHGLVARAGRRGWRVADPFLRAALLSTPLSSP